MIAMVLEALRPGAFARALADSSAQLPLLCSRLPS